MTCAENQDFKVRIKLCLRSIKTPLSDFLLHFHIFCPIIVSTGGMRRILWFSVRYSAAARREIFGVNALRGKLHQLGSPNLQDFFIGG